MMKKLLLLGSILALGFAANAQGSSVLVTDKLHYYQNKFIVRNNGNVVGTINTPSYESDATALATFTNITFVGSRFEVPAGETVTVTGLEGFFAKPGKETVSIIIPIRLYLCRLNANGLPILPAIDSVNVGLGGTGSPPPMKLLSGPFTSTNTLAARTMTADFAVLARNVSDKSGDYCKMFHTPCITATNTVQHGMHKYADEGYGYVRHNGVFYTTKDFVYAPNPSAFGIGTNYEFMVAPIVQYSLNPSHILPMGVVADTDAVTVPDTQCTRSPYVFTNNSSKFYLNRQYNYHELCRQKQFYAMNTDSTFSWNFEFLFYEGETRRFLPRSSNNITVASGYSIYKDCFTANEFRARFKCMDTTGSGPKYDHNEGFKICNRWCNDDTVGVPGLAGLEEVRIFPNPAVNGKTKVTGLKGANTVEVYNMTGQLIFSRKDESDAIEINLSAYPKGAYILKISNADHRSRAVRIMNAD